MVPNWSWAKVKGDLPARQNWLPGGPILTQMSEYLNLTDCPSSLSYSCSMANSSSWNFWISLKASRFNRLPDSGSFTSKRTPMNPPFDGNISFCLSSAIRDGLPAGVQMRDSSSNTDLLAIPPERRMKPSREIQKTLQG
jgi:hypothetical protein